MTVTNTSQYGRGISMRNAKVELIDVALQECNSYGLDVSRSSSETTLVATRCEFANSMYGAQVEGSLASATFKNCVFKDNIAGIFTTIRSTVHLHGEATAIHSNTRYGIWANNSGKVLIHLPSHHNTIYNSERDRFTTSGGTITNVED